MDVRILYCNCQNHVNPLGLPRGRAMHGHMEIQFLSISFNADTVFGEDCIEIIGQKLCWANTNTQAESLNGISHTRTILKFIYVSTLFVFFQQRCGQSAFVVRDRL